jgi:hypothetical protein
MRCVARGDAKNGMVGGDGVSVVATLGTQFCIVNGTNGGRRCSIGEILRTIDARWMMRSEAAAK